MELIHNLKEPTVLPALAALVIVGLFILLVRLQQRDRLKPVEPTLDELQSRVRQLGRQINSLRVKGRIRSGITSERQRKKADIPGEKPNQNVERSSIQVING